jgi:hypothetical protein
MVEGAEIETYPEYLTTPKAAAYLGLSESLLEKRRCTGGGSSLFQDRQSRSLS